MKVAPIVRAIDSDARRAHSSLNYLTPHAFKQQHHPSQPSRPPRMNGSKKPRQVSPLVMVGMRGWLTSRVESLMQPMLASGEIRLLGFTSDEDLAVLYAAALTLVCPSL